MDTTLYEGDRGAAVEELQTLLRNRGYRSVTVDGYFGAATKAAVIDFQSRNNLVADGIVGPKTWAALRGGTGSDPDIYLQEGNSGQMVERLQMVLRAHEYDITVDGYFGSRTTAAVLDFQRKRPQELQADGIVGAKTWVVLWREVLNESDTGEAVRQLQQLLRNRGYDLNVSGTFDAVTKTAVMDFQRKNNLPADGIVGRRTLRALQDGAPINLVDVCRFYDPTRFPHQTRALEWLQRNIPSGTLTTFARLWRDPNASAN